MDSRCFFEIRCQLPNDFNTDVENLPEAWIDELFAATIQLPESSDMDSTKIEPVYVKLAERIVEQICLEWSYRNGKGCADFFQLEQTENGFHIHCLLETKGMKGFVFARFLNSFKSRIQDRVYAGKSVLIENWFAASKNKNVGGANRTRDDGYIKAYLMPKTQSELQWAWSNISEYQSALLNLSERKRIYDEYIQQCAEIREQKRANGENPRVSGKNTERYMELVNWLVERGITSEKEWIREDSESYLTYNASSTSRGQIKSALDNAAKVMMLTKTAEDYLIGRQDTGPISMNRVFRIFKLNGYDPALAGSILLGWAKRQFGKRNAIWLYGPATTGKTNIAEAIAHAVPFYGCVNWTNENFPFNDCVDKMIIWWEEGKMTGKVVESAKAILGGSKVRVDQKCKSSQQIESTPVIITSNTDMTIVIDGNQITMEHRQPLEDRMFKFYLGHRLPHDFGKISKAEIRAFFRWAERNQVPVDPCFEVPTHTYKRHREEPESSFSGDPREKQDASDVSSEPSPKKVKTDAKSDEAENSSADSGTVDKTPAQKACEEMLNALKNETPKADIVHDNHDVACKHGKYLFCSECDFSKNVKTHNKYLECPDSNKEQ
uniref:Replication protein n=1 Tax=Dependoparvovirus sp. TaxID=2052559 RepID=A0A6M9Z9Y2_9VIRU|nr:MAG: replication protein [Dependoparvovirus sp.]